MDTSPMNLVGGLARRDSWSADRCSISRTLSVVGTRSGLLLMREAHYGTTRFDDFASRVGISEKVTAQRLRELVEAGLLSRRPYREPGSRTRDEYVLTPAGSELCAVLIALMQWGDRHLSDPAGPPLRLEHLDCGAAVSAAVRCAAGHDVPPGEIAVRSARAG